MQQVVQLFLQFICVYFSVICSMSTGEKDSKHCHDSNRALEDREQEKKLARKRLYIVSAVCLVFMVGEILGMSGGFFDMKKTVIACTVSFAVACYISLGDCVNRWIFRWQSGSDDGCCPPTGGFH